MKPVVYLTRVAGGQAITQKLEGEEALGILKSQGFGFIAEDGAGRKGTKRGAVCPECGMRTTTFQKTGRFGCPGCYDHFLPYIGDLLGKMHEGTLHLGKTPRRRADDSAPEKRLPVWQDRLRNLVARENFEEAAVVRDEIGRLEKLLPAGKP